MSRGLLLLALLALAACGLNARQKAVNATMASLDAASSTFVKYDADKQQAIVAAAKDKASGEAALHAWRDTRNKLELAFATAYRAVAVAATLDNDQSVTAMVQAAAIVTQELRQAGVIP